MTAEPGTRTADAHEPGRFLGWFRRPGLRMFAVGVNDGIVGTAGVLQGFAGADATPQTMFIASVAALVAGAVAGGGSQYVELAAQRDAEQAIVRAEQAELAADPADAAEDVEAALEASGVPDALASAVAERLTAHDPIGSQLAIEHGIPDPLPWHAPVLGALAHAFAIALGGALPLAVLLLYPAAWESWALFVAVLVSVAVVSALIALSAGTNPWRALLRMVLVGVITMVAAFFAGELAAVLDDTLRPA
ncbi:MAG: VIT1/CCC1 transporter family protein [Microbacteriaceae bacterium]|nr:VIT1/CCC1 transporter family protein [Microbacteriaceae bacterium]